MRLKKLSLRCSKFYFRGLKTKNINNKKIKKKKKRKKVRDSFESPWLHVQPPRVRKQSIYKSSYNVNIKMDK